MWIPCEKKQKPMSQQLRHEQTRPFCRLLAEESVWYYPEDCGVFDTVGRHSPPPAPPPAADMSGVQY
ncbi:MAG: hypothetical protein B6D34_12605 [Candidatus Brocadia sp. UTAMX1]|nr:MAG: hypothetical protein B6D34_12605 [Candidatus Brocadia sp. UTAMX1]